MRAQLRASYFPACLCVGIPALSLWRQPCHICCEFGNSDASTFLQKLENNRIVASLELGSPIEMAQDANLFAGWTIGADLTARNHGPFTLAGLAIYNVVLDYWQKEGLAAAIFQEFSEQP